MRGRRYRLRPWIVRCLLPDDVIGTYVLWNQYEPFYAGRSDTSLRRRLTEHTSAHRNAYFTFHVAHSPELAFDMECSLFHALDGGIRNLIHPGRPEYSVARCPFCRGSFEQMCAARLSAVSTASQ